MKVKNLSKNKKNNYYNVLLDNGNSYVFSEEVILKYRLVNGKEIDDKILDDAISFNNISDIYQKAMRYAIRYMKSKREIYEYIFNKTNDEYITNDIINKLIENHIIDDNKIIDSYIYSYIINSNGINMIKEKLYQKGFNQSLIDKKILDIDYDLYYEYLKKLYNKIKNKYDNPNDYIRINKIKNYLYQRGYTYSDMEELDIK